MLYKWKLFWAQARRRTSFLSSWANTPRVGWADFQNLRVYSIEWICRFFHPEDLNGLSLSDKCSEILQPSECVHQYQGTDGPPQKLSRRWPPLNAWFLDMLTKFAHNISLYQKDLLDYCHRNLGIYQFLNDIIIWISKNSRIYLHWWIFMYPKNAQLIKVT